MSICRPESPNRTETSIRRTHFLSCKHDSRTSMNCGSSRRSLSIANIVIPFAAPRWTDLSRCRWLDTRPPSPCQLVVSLNDGSGKTDLRSRIKNALEGRQSSLRTSTYSRAGEGASCRDIVFSVSTYMNTLGLCSARGAMTRVSRVGL